MHEKCRKLTSAGVTQNGSGEDYAILVLCVTKHTAMDQCIRVLDTLSPHHTTDAATVDLPYVFVCVSVHAENKQHFSSCIYSPKITHAIDRL